MASDYVLYHVQKTTATATKMEVLSGSINVRSGYGQAKLKSIRALYHDADGGNKNCYIEVRNSNWVRGLNIIASRYGAETSLGTETYGYTLGHDALLTPNSSFNITASLSATSTSAVDIYCLIEIDYSDVPTNDVKSAKGFPMSVPISMSGNIAANTQTRLANVDNLDPGVEYLLSEVRGNTINPQPISNQIPCFIVLSGVQSMRGLNIIVPIREVGEAIVPQIMNSVKWVKQSYNVDVITGATNGSITIDLHLEFIASSNSV